MKVQSYLTFSDAVYMLKKYDSSRAKRSVDLTNSVWYIWDVRMGGLVSVIDGKMSESAMSTINVEAAYTRDWEVWL